MIRKSEIAASLDTLPEIKNSSDRQSGILKLFLMHEISKSQKSFWYEYLQITEKPDILIQWTERELNDLQEESLKQNVMEEKAKCETEFKMIKEFVSKWDKVYKVDNFTYDTYLIAHSHVVTRCFGFYSEMLLVPFADLVNHNIADSSYCMFNDRLNKQTELTEEKRQYDTGKRKACDFKKHWQEPQIAEDTIVKEEKKEGKLNLKERLAKALKALFVKANEEVEEDPPIVVEKVEKEDDERPPVLSTKSKRYIDKLLKRRDIASKDPNKITKLKFKGQAIWDLDYVSSSDEENPYYSRGGKNSDDEDAVTELSKEDI